MFFGVKTYNTMFFDVKTCNTMFIGVKTYNTMFFGVKTYDTMFFGVMPGISHQCCIIFLNNLKQSGHNTKMIQYHETNVFWC